MSEPIRPDDEPCEWEDSVSAYVLGNLSGQDKIGMEQHLANGCSKCEVELTAATETLENLAESSPATGSATSRERFLSLLDRERRPQDKALESGIIFSKSGLLISRSEALAWQASKIPGIWTRVLFVDAEQHCVTSIVRMDPATYYPSHRHGGPEEIFLLTGSITVEGNSMRPGDYCHAAAGSIHGRSFTNSGCTFILRSCELDEIIDGP